MKDTFLRVTKEQGEFEISFAIAAILLIMTFIINTSAEIIGKKMKKYTVLLLLLTIIFSISLMVKSAFSARSES